MQRAALFVLCATALSPAHADTLYVSDKLVLNVYAEAAQGSTRVATIETGDAVEEIERADNHVRVRLTDGREGWVGANYLTAQPPAITRLKQLESAGPASATPSPDKALTEQLARLQKQNTALTAEVAALKAKPVVNAAPASAPAVAPQEPALPPAETTAMTRTEKVEDTSEPRGYVWLWGLAVLVAAAAGFTAGYQTLARRVRARFGGVKVY